MTAVYRCDGCGAFTPSTGDGRVGWLQVRRYEDKDELQDNGGFWFTASDPLTTIGHACSLVCLGNLALSQNDPQEARS